MFERNRNRCNDKNKSSYVDSDDELKQREKARDKERQMNININDNRSRSNSRDQHRSRSTDYKNIIANAQAMVIVKSQRTTSKQSFTEDEKKFQNKFEMMLAKQKARNWININLKK